MVVIPIVMSLRWVTHNHYMRVARRLRIDPTFEVDRRGNTIVVLLSGVHRSSVQAIGFARSLNPDRIICAAVGDDDFAEHLREDWAEFAVTEKLGVELQVIDSPYRELTRPLLAFLDELALEHPRDLITVVLPELVVEKWWEQLLHNQSALALKLRLRFRPNTVVVSVPLHLNPKYHEVASDNGAAMSEEEADRM
jgi:hypothetical protein